MECNGEKTMTPLSTPLITIPSPYYTNSPPSTVSSSASPATSPPLNNIVVTPCAACKTLRRKCASDKCVLAPYFPPTEPLKFTTSHRVFGASNIIKLLQDLPESQRADAVSSMVYEANARIKDPVYGSAGSICHLQNQISDLKTQLAKAQAQIAYMQCQQSNLVTLICMKLAQSKQNSATMQQVQDQPNCYQDTNMFFNHHHHHHHHDEDEYQLGSPWEALWT